MKNTVLILSLLIIPLLNFAQKYQINIAYSGSKFISEGSGSVDLLWNFSPYLRLGGYVAADRLFEYSRMDSMFWHSNTDFDLGLSVALNGNLSLMPLIKTNINWFDLYAIAQIGTSYAFYENNFPERGFHPFYSYGGGISIRVIKNFGVFTEITRSSLFGVTDFPIWRLGGTYRF